MGREQQAALNDVAPAESAAESAATPGRTSSAGQLGPTSGPYSQPSVFGGTAAKPDSASDGKTEGTVDLSAELVGTQEIEAPDAAADVPAHNLEAGKAELAAHGKSLPAQGGAEEVESGGIKPDAAHGAPAAGEDSAPASPEVQSQVTQAQSDAKEALAQSEAESSAYKAEMKEKRDRFEDEQHATMLEQLKTMSASDKRATLKDLGYDAKAIKKLKDNQLDGIITGKMETEARKTRILGMDPDELKALPPARKIQYLVDLGIDKGDLDKAGEGKATKLFDDIMAVAHVPGQHTCKIKIKGGLFGKSWVVNVNCDAEGNTQIDAKKEGGFFSKLWGWVKAALPIILVVLAPLTGGASLLVLAVYQAAMAIKNGDWLGAVIGVAGALSGFGVALVAKGAVSAAGTLAKVAEVARKVKVVAETAQAAMAASKAKNAGSLLGALAGAAGTFAHFSANTASKFATTMQSWSDRLKKWGAVIGGGEKVIKGIKSHDPLGAISGALETASAAVAPKSTAGKQLQKATAITGFVTAGKRALASNPPDYGAVAQAALGIADTLKQDRRLEDASRIVGSANRLKQAWDQRETNPTGLADAALELAQSIQVAKYDLGHDEKKDKDGTALPDEDRQAILDKYSRAQRVVTAASAAIKAVMAKPRPNYLAALDAGSQLIAEFTDDKRVDAAAVVTSRLNAWTQAVNSKDENAIIEAGRAFGEAINGLRSEINESRKAAKAKAEATLQPGDKLPEGEAGEIPHFEETVSVTAEAPVVPLIPPPIATEIDFSQLPQYSGAGGTPGATTGPGGQQAGQQGPGGRLAPPVSTEKQPEPQPPKKEKPPPVVPEDVAQIVKVIKIASEIAKQGGFKSGKALVDQWYATVKLFEDLQKEPETTAEAYDQKLAAIRFIKSSGDFALVVSKELGPYEAQFRSGISSGDLRVAALSLGRTVRNLGRFIRAAEIPQTILEASDNLVIVCGYKADLSGQPATTMDRINAAAKLAQEVASMPEELSWLGRIGAEIAKKLGAESAAAALNVVKRSVNRYGEEAVRVTMRRVTPILEKITEKEGSQVAIRVAEKIGAAIAEWGGAQLVKATSNALLREACVLLAKNVGLVVRISVSAPVAIAFEVGELEMHYANELYMEAHATFSHYFSSMAFGQTIDQLKRDLVGRQTSTERQADTLINYMFYSFLSSARYDIRGQWLPYTWQELPRRAMRAVPEDFSGNRNPVEYLTKLEPMVKTELVGPILKDIAMDFLDREYKRIYNEDP